MPQRYSMPIRRQKLQGHFIVKVLYDSKHYNIVDNLGIFDRLEITGGEIKRI